ncbi:MAG: DUF2802 domain-containing protein [Azoarcus sp.]|jgi:hypothetical protein|nr:DUF2802 domain-containing protein [Azoarcus sp.]
MTRQLLWSLIALLMVYGGWQFFRALRAAPRRRVESLSGGGGAGGEPDDLDDDLFDYAPMPAAGLSTADAADATDRAAIHADADDDAPPPSAAPAKNATDLFALELDVQRLRREIQGLREAFDEQQENIDALRAEVESLPARSATVTAAEPGASPEYGEALALARRGAMSGEIAARCGITRAEADLVTSLAAHDRRQEPMGGTTP